ncbi:hypothetical protein F3Y22_tig00110017pilonHSYRG00017 [Hibiscus syriacus]|uniref:RNase H type-1 domain-containing protein n=1 Tax=Hibiscus syriacus TaxID=106335 RepID=A0A6A3BMA2_HIBSY|nr:hypothetical protein F3Y22_tig00110017pilonHSYRG00017 [Hibiscus syriacus]
MVACSYPNFYVANPETAEALACEQAVSLSRELRFFTVIIEGDALVVINKISQPSNGNSEIRAIVQNVQAMGRDFETLSFTHVRRSQNAAAHVLAKIGRSFLVRMVWLEVAPVEVEASVARDRWWVDPPN